MKCPKCGCEFEGNFCPNCGTVAGEVTHCPVCGKKRTNNERFCSECGYAFEKPEQKKEIDAPAVIYKILSYAPLALFAAMAVLALLFSIAPAVTGLFSISAYGLLGDDSIDGLQGAAIFLLIAEVLFLVAAAALAFLLYRFKSAGDNRFLNVLKYSIFVSAAYYLILFIIGIVMCVQIAAFDDGFGVFSAGACPILFIIFSILFGIAEAASVVLNRQLEKKHPQIKEDMLIISSSAAGGVSAGAAGQAMRKERAPLSAKTKKKITVFAVLLAVVIIAVIVIVIVANNLSNIFRIGKVSQINLGDTKSQVVEILGEPDDESDTMWIYYSSEYTDILDEIEEIEEQYDSATTLSELENLLEQETELYVKLATITYKTITVYFEESESKNTESEYIVSSVWFNADICEDYIGNVEKTLKSVTILSGAFEQYSTDITVEITYEAEFTDGSYVKNSATASRNSSGTITNTDNITVTWGDKWHSSYYKDIKIEEKGYYVDTETGNDENSYNINGNILYITSDSLLYLTEMSSSEKAAITEVIISEGVTRIYGNINDLNTAFSGFTSLQKITIPDTVTSIGWGAFYGCTSLESITIPDSVISIGEYAFNSCTSLENVYIGSGLSEIGDWALENCTALNNIMVSSNNSVFKSIDGSLYSYDEKTLIQYAIGKTDSSFTIPSSVTTICNGAFAFCQYLTEVTISKNVTSIEYIAFMECSNLKSITFENTSGWYVVDYDYDYTEISRESISVTSASKNATYFKDTYCYYYWYRSEN